MPYAQVITSAFNASTGGGTFADSLAAVTGDSLAVANFGNGGARILEAWAINSAHVGELEVIYTRPEATHDQQNGWRTSIQAVAFGTVAKVGEVSLLGGMQTLRLFKSDTPQVKVSSTAGDGVVYSFVTEYDDLPGVAGNFVTPSFIEAHHKSRVGIRVSAQANTGTLGQIGTTRAFNADDDRLHANTWYAIEGATVQTLCTTINIQGPDFGGQRVGLPGGSIEIASSGFFVNQSVKWGKPMVPCFNSNNKASTLVSIVDCVTSTTPQVDFQLRELDLPSTWSGTLGGY